MRKLIVGILMFGLIFGTAAVTKAADFDIHFAKSRIYNSYDNFSSWDARQRDRINDAYRDRLITRYEFKKLNRELSDVETYHDQVFSKGWISKKERENLERMEARLSADIHREMNEHMD